MLLLSHTKKIRKAPQYNFSQNLKNSTLQPFWAPFGEKQVIFKNCAPFTDCVMSQILIKHLLIPSYLKQK